MEDDGMILVKAKKKPGSTESDTLAYSVPHTLYSGLARAIHIRLSHPSKSQLANIMTRYFYSPGYLRIIDEILDNCTNYQSLKILPKVLLRSEFLEIKQFASQFLADILERCSQRVIVVREEITQMMLTELIPDQTTPSLRSSLIRLISPNLSRGSPLRQRILQMFSTGPASPLTSEGLPTRTRMPRPRTPSRSSRKKS